MKKLIVSKIVEKKFFLVDKLVGCLVTAMRFTQKDVVHYHTVNDSNYLIVNVVHRPPFAIAVIYVYSTTGIMNCKVFFTLILCKQFMATFS